MLFFIRSLVVQLFLNVYFVYRIRRHQHIHFCFKYLLYFLIGLEMLIFFTGLFAGTYLPDGYFAVIMKINAFWSIFSAYFAGLSLIFDLIFYLNKKWVFHIKFRDSTLIILYGIIFISFFTSISFHLHSSKDNYLEPQIREFSFRFQSHSTDTIQTKTKYRLLMVSDLHLGYLIDKKVLQKYVNLLNDQHADVMVINGDLIDYYLEVLKNQRMEEELKRLYAPLGVYFVPGNHEYRIDAEVCFDWIRKAGIPVLRDSIVTINQHFQLIGRDDRKNKEHRMKWEKLVSQSDSTQTRLLVTHQPGDIKEALPYNFPLILCGHTHRGQIFPANLYALFLFHNAYGLQQESASSWSYTTSGMGLSGFPFRIGTQSEIVIFNIEFY